MITCGNKNVFIVTDESGNPVEGAVIAGTAMTIPIDPETTDDRGRARIPKGLQKVHGYTISKEEYETLFEYFDDQELGLADRFKPLVYAIFYFTEDERYRRLPSELAEPVDAIIQKVKQLAQDYAE